MLNPEDHCQDQCQEAFSLFFFSSSLVFAGFTMKTLIHFELNSVYAVRQRFSQIPLQGYLVSPVLFILSSLHNFGAFVEKQLIVYARIYLGALCSFPLSYVSVFMPVPCCFGYCSFVI